MLDEVGHRILVADGAMGTELQRAGLPIGQGGERWNLDRPDVIEAVHAAYLDAGCDIVLTNSFGATRWILERHGLADRVDEVNRAAARIGRRAAGGARLVLGDVGPTGFLLEPLGPVTRDELRADAHRRIHALLEEGADGIIGETMTALDEAVVVVETARAAGAKWIVGSMAFDRLPNGKVRTMMGVSPEEAGRRLRDAGASMVGANCGTHLEVADFAGILTALAAASGLPVMIQPNAGQPRLDGDRAVYDMGGHEFALAMQAVIAAGAAVVGGCCGTGPAHIRALRATVDASEVSDSTGRT